MGHVSRMIIKLVTWRDEIMPALRKNAVLFSTCYKSNGFSEFRPQTHLDLSLLELEGKENGGKYAGAHIASCAG